MTKAERDPHTGRMTTGHEWNGITELNTPVPKPVWFFLTLGTLCAVIMWILFPTWPTVESYTKGLLGVDQRSSVEESLKNAAGYRADWTTTLESADVAALQADAAIMAHVGKTGPRLFEDNCAACHGVNATGAKGYPNLVDDQWLWGGDPDAIMETLRVGINAPHQQTRNSLMPAFGRDGMLSVEQRRQVVSYIQSLSTSPGADLEKVAPGKEIFIDHCASCHGADGMGLEASGAPNLTDDFWIYGGDIQSITETIYNGRQGWMPHWEGRLSVADRKLLTLYILELGKDPK